jgi:hypothetical protein
MGIGGGSGGGGFKLEKTWRATGVGTTTFNSPGNFTIPFGKYEVLVSGRAGTGNPNTPGTISSYNPVVPSTISGYNPTIPSNISGYNTTIAGNATGNYNAGSGGNLAGYTQTGGNLAGYNVGNPPTSGVYFTEFVYFINSGFYYPPIATGGQNPVSGGTLAGYNTYVAGSATYNSPTPGGFATIYTAYVCEPAGAPQFIGFYVDVDVYNSFYDETVYNVIYSPNCPAPTTNYQTISPTPGNATGSYNPPSGGNPVYNPLTPGNPVYNASQYDPGYEFTMGPFNPQVSPSCPSPYTTYELNPVYGSTNYETVNYSCTPFTSPGTPGTANYNAITNEAVFNAFVSGNQNFNPPTGGNPNYNAAVNSTANYNAIGGQNANYNSPLGGIAGAPTNVLGVYMQGGNVGAVAPFVSPTLINRYIADDATYPVTVPTGGYVTIQSK